MESKKKRQPMLVDPRRNFATLSPKQHLFVQAQQLLEGDIDHKLPVHNQQLLLQEMFCVVGKAWGHCFLVLLHLLRFS